jgi:hypothetical protein
MRRFAVTRSRTDARAYTERFGDDRQITPLRDDDLLTNIAAALTIAD